MNNLIESRQIRVFISSTFQDMKDERDYLIGRTFPKLRRMAAERDVMLTELDLRWGITEEESKTGKVVEICLREIKNSVPFFVGIVGNRYGWVPKKEELGEEVFSQFPKIDGYLESHLSVTEMEMQFGVLDRPEDMHAFFYIKQQEETADDPVMLKRLKEEIKRSRYPSSTYSSVEDLAQQVEKAFVGLLDQLFPKTALSQHQKERLVQHSFISQLSATYVKVEDNFQRLTDFCHDPSSPFLVVTGESGLGKSALLANWSKAMQTQDEFAVIPYFSSNGGQQTYKSILTYLADEICERFGMESPQGKSEKERLEKLFDQFALRTDRLVIVFDAINQIADVDHAKMLNWLPFPPNNVKYLFSTLEDDITMEVFQNKGYPVFRLQKLTRGQKTQLVEQYLRNYGKKLNQNQIDRIVDSPQSDNTLVLRSLLEELIGFGVYEALDQRIDYYLDCTSVKQFYGKVIARFEEDYGRDFVRSVLGLIAVSRNGVSEQEILEITKAKPIEWSEFYCAFVAHLNNQSGRLVFTHSYITQTVWERYLTGHPEFESECRRKIAEVHRDDLSTNAMLEVSYQYDHLQEWDLLHDYMVSWRYLDYYMDFDEIEIATYWRHVFEGRLEKYSIKDYLDVTDCDDLVSLYIKLMKLSGVLYVNVGKEVAVLLRDYIEEHPELASAKVYLALASVFDRPQSIEYAKKALQLCQEQGNVKGEIEAYGRLGAIYYDAIWVGREEQYEALAQDVFMKAKDLSVAYYGEMHPAVMHCYEDYSLNNSGDLDEGLFYAQKALEIGRAIFGDEHPLTGRPYHYIGVLYREKGEWKKALHNFQMACRNWLPAYGIYHGDMVASYNNQGRALMNLGRYEEALACYDKCLTIQNVISERIGCDHAIHHLNRARVLQLLGRTEEATNECLIVRSILEDEQVKTEGRCKELQERLEDFIKTL